MSDAGSKKRGKRQVRRKVKKTGKSAVPNAGRTRLRARFKKKKKHETLAPPTPADAVEHEESAADHSMSEDSVKQDSRLLLDKSMLQDEKRAEEKQHTPEKMTIVLQTQQIRHAMAEIRKLYADRTAPILSRRLSTLPMTVQEFCYYVVLRTHKSRRVNASTSSSSSSSN